MLDIINPGRRRATTDASEWISGIINIASCLLGNLMVPDPSLRSLRGPVFASPRIIK
jgi:hypothetical protein